MYNFPYFKEPDPEKVLQFIQQHPFAFLTGCNAQQQPVATQVPMFIDRQEDGRLLLTGHIQKKTDHHLAFAANPSVLAVFTGPHTYVSASWYSNPLQGSTWNYMSVHAKGQLRFLDNAALWQVLQRTTARFENNPQSPSLADKLPAGYVEQMMKAIVAFEITVTAMDNVFKLSQNRDAESYNTIIERLHAKGGDAALVAGEMEQRREALFDPQPPKGGN